MKGLTLVVLAFLATMTGCACTSVDAGTVGVQKTFGAVSNDVLSEGFHLVNPLSSVDEISIRTTEEKEDMTVPSREGLSVQLEVSAMYRVDPKRAVDLYRTVGLDYAETLIVPLLRSEVRSVTVQHEAKSLYTAGREEISRQMQEALAPQLAPRGIILEAVLLRKVSLPDSLQNAINAKLAAEQAAQQMEFTIAKEKAEAERKRIEAQGIAEYQRITAREVNEAILRWKGIEATERLATSPNAKIVIIGGGKDSLPLVLQGQ